MGFTLIVGREDDLCCRLVQDRLGAIGRDFVFTPEDTLFPGLHFVWELRNGRSRGSIGFAAKQIDFDQISGVLARFSGITTSPQEHRTKDGQYLNSEWHALARGYMHSLPCPVMNRLRPELWYKSRLAIPDLISLAPRLKFRLPKTRVTTKFADARAFFHFCGERMLYSPLSMPSNYVIEEEQDLAKLEPLAKVLPLYLSEYVPGEATRVFVVGNGAVFDGEPNVAVTQACLEAAAALGLTFCEFELIRTSGGEWYCLGLNCMPQLIQCSDEVRGSIVNRLADALCAGNGRRTV